jgi:hypothetical protein
MDWALRPLELAAVLAVAEPVEKTGVQTVPG